MDQLKSCSQSPANITTEKRDRWLESYYRNENLSRNIVSNHDCRKRNHLRHSRQVPRAIHVPSEARKDELEDVSKEFVSSLEVT